MKTKLELQLAVAVTWRALQVLPELELSADMEQLALILEHHLQTRIAGLRRQLRQGEFIDVDTSGTAQHAPSCPDIPSLNLR